MQRATGDRTSTGHYRHSDENQWTSDKGDQTNNRNATDGHCCSAQQRFVSLVADIGNNAHRSRLSVDINRGHRDTPNPAKPSESPGSSHSHRHCSDDTTGLGSHDHAIMALSRP